MVATPHYKVLAENFIDPLNQGIAAPATEFGNANVIVETIIWVAENVGYERCLTVTDEASLHDPVQFED